MNDENLKKFGNAFKKQVTEKKRKEIVDNNKIGEGFFLDKGKKRSSGFFSSVSGCDYPDVIGSDEGSKIIDNFYKIVLENYLRKKEIAGKFEDWRPEGKSTNFIDYIKAGEYLGKMFNNGWNLGNFLTWDDPNIIGEIRVFNINTPIKNSPRGITEINKLNKNKELHLWAKNFCGPIPLGLRKNPVSDEIINLWINKIISEFIDPNNLNATQARNLHSFNWNTDEIFVDEKNDIYVLNPETGEEVHGYTEIIKLGDKLNCLLTLFNLRNAAINAVKTHWNNNAASLTGKTLEGVLTATWEKTFDTLTNATTINGERDKLIGLIDRAKAVPVDPNITLRNAAINAVKTHWNNNAASLTGKTLEGVLTATWEKTFDTLTNATTINGERDKLIGLINGAKLSEDNTTIKNLLSVENINDNQVKEWKKIDETIITQIVKEYKNNADNNNHLIDYLKNQGVYEENSPIVKTINEVDKDKAWKKFVSEYQPEQVFKTIAACEYTTNIENNNAKKKQLITEIASYRSGNQIIDTSKYGGADISQWKKHHFIQYLSEKMSGNKFVMKDQTITVPTNKEKPFHRLDNWKMWGTYSIILLIIGVAITYWKNKVNSEEEDKDIY